MRIAFIIDPPDSLKAKKDSSVAMMRAAQNAGHAVWAIEQPAIHSSPLHGVCAEAVHLEVFGDDKHGERWYREIVRHNVPLRDFAAVLMRKDPPFDMEYVTTTWLLERAEAEGARVFNKPAALRDHSEKLAILEFPQFITPTLVSREAAPIQSFIDAHQDCVLKPLDGMGGSQVFRVRADDLNRNVIIETLTWLGRRTIMAQRPGRAVLPGAHSQSRRDARQSGRWRTRRGAGAERARPRDRRSSGSDTHRARPAVRRHRRHRRLPDRDQRHQSDLHGRSRRT